MYPIRRSSCSGPGTWAAGQWQKVSGAPLCLQQPRAAKGADRGFQGRTCDSAGQGHPVDPLARLEEPGIVGQTVLHLAKDRTIHCDLNGEGSGAWRIDLEGVREPSADDGYLLWQVHIATLECHSID